MTAFSIQGGSDIKTDRAEINITRAVLWGLAAYFLVSVILRVCVSGAADMDETELLVLTQTLQPGYGSQLPLYAWLQYLSFSLSGVNILALSFVKYSLLFATYVCVMKIALKVFNDDMSAAIATLSLFLIPQIAWESYRTLSNTVLATFMAALTLLLFLRLREKPTVINYLLLGAAAGLGLLSKYNYALFLAALVASGLATPAFRKTLISTRSMFSLTAMLALAVPPYIWILQNIDKATSSSKKLQALGGGSILHDWVFGFSSLIAAATGYCWPALIVFAALFFGTRPVRSTAPDGDYHQFFSRFLVAAFTVCSVLVIFFRVTYFKERWLQPLLFFLPIYFMFYLGSRINPKRFRALTAIALVPAILAMITFSGSVLLASRSGRATRLSPPYQAMAAHLVTDGFEGGNIITNDHRIGGNFRLTFKSSPILIQGMMETGFNKDDPTLVLWNADKDESPPDMLLAYAEMMLGEKIETALAGYVEKPMLYWEEKSMKLGYIVIEQPKD